MPGYSQMQRAAAPQKAADGGAASHARAQGAVRDGAMASYGVLADALNESPRTQSLLQMRRALDESPRVQAQLALQRALNRRGVEPAQTDSAEASLHPASAPVQRKPNGTGLPDQLKAGVESLSGFAMDDVRVHYNSSKPAAVQAHAYAQGTDIHVAPGQEKHLPHEVWHVVQQKQGRVKPTLQMKGVAINDDDGLEHEADAMGAKTKSGGTLPPRARVLRSPETASSQMPALVQAKGWLWKGGSDWKEVDEEEKGEGPPNIEPQSSQMNQVYDDKGNKWFADSNAYQDAIGVVKKLKGVLIDGLKPARDLGGKATTSADLTSAGSKVNVNVVRSARETFNLEMPKVKDAELAEIEARYRFKFQELAEEQLQLQFDDDPDAKRLNELDQLDKQYQEDEARDLAAVHAWPEEAKTDEEIRWAAEILADKATNVKSKGAIPVAIEQEGDEPVPINADTKSVLSKRALESALIIIETERLDENQQKNIAGTTAPVSEYHHHGPILPSNFFGTLVPKDYQGYFSAAEIEKNKIKFVDYKDGSFEHMVLGPEIQIDMVPDYESELASILAANPDKIFLTSVVRLGKRDPLKKPKSKGATGSSTASTIDVDANVDTDSKNINKSTPSES
jgi:hypothetical protein